MITDFTSLKQTVANQFVNTEIVEFLDAAIRMVEADMNRNVRVRRMIARDTATMDSQYTAFPADFLTVAGLQVNANPVQKLDFVTIEKMDEMKPEYRTSGVPRWFTIIGQEIEVLPVPDGEYQAELTYYERIPALSDVNTTNWLLTGYPDVYFYGTLKFCANYVTDRYDRPDKRGALWSEMFDAAKEEMIVEDDKNRFSRGKLVMRARSYS